jgi:hypothetical protein
MKMKMKMKMTYPLDSLSYDTTDQEEGESSNNTEIRQNIIPKQMQGPQEPPESLQACNPNL